MNYDNKKQQTFISVAASVLLTVSVITLSFFVYAKSLGMNIAASNVSDMISGVFSTSRNDEYWELSYNPSTDHILGICRDYLVIYSNGQLRGIGRDGLVKWSDEKTLIEPKAATSGRYMVIADSSNGYVRVLDGRKTIWDIEIDSEIYGVSINEYGYTVITQEPNGYKSSIALYDPKGSLIFTRRFAKKLVISSYIYSNNNTVLTNIVDTDGLFARTIIEFTDKLGNPVNEIISEADDIFTAAGNIGGNTYLANDKSIIWYNVKGDIIEKNDFTIITSIVELPSGTIAAAVTPLRDSTNNAKSMKIVYYNSYGEVDNELDVEGKIESLRSYDDILCVNTGYQITFADNNQNTTSYRTNMTGIREVHFFNREEAVYITRDRINYVKTNLS